MEPMAAVSVLLTRLQVANSLPAAVYTVGIDANLLAVADLNGDGKQDVVVASQSSKALAVSC